MANKKYIEKSYTFPSGLSCNCFIISYYVHTIKDDAINFRIEGFKDISCFKNNLSSVELQMDFESTFNTNFSVLPIGVNDEERIIKYLKNNIDFFKDGIIKTI